MLFRSNGEEYLLEGNFSKIKDMFVPSKSYDASNGTIYKLRRPVGQFLQNEFLKEISPCHYDEKIQLGHGISEHYYIQKNTNKIIKFYGNSSQIKNLLEEVVIPVSKPVPPKVITKILPTKVEVVEKTIIRETTPVVGEKGSKGDKGDIGDIGPKGQRGSKIGRAHV